MNVTPALAAKAAGLPPRGALGPWSGPAALEISGAKRFVK